MHTTSTKPLSIHFFPEERAWLAGPLTPRNRTSVRNRVRDTHRWATGGIAIMRELKLPAAHSRLGSSNPPSLRRRRSHSLLLPTRSRCPPSPVTYSVLLPTRSCYLLIHQNLRCGKNQAVWTPLGPPGAIESAKDARPICSSAHRKNSREAGNP